MLVTSCGSATGSLEAYCDGTASEHDALAEVAAGAPDAIAIAAANLISKYDGACK